MGQGLHINMISLFDFSQSNLPDLNLYIGDQSRFSSEYT